MGRHAFGGRHRHCGRTPQGSGKGGAFTAGWLSARGVRATAVLAGAALATALGVQLGAQAAQREPLPVAKVELPAGAEALSPYLPQVSCDPRAKPGVVAFRALMLATYRTGRDGGIVTGCSVGGLSEHKEGRAWDWMLSVYDSHQRRVADTVLDWLLAPGPGGQPAWNARRFGIMYIIWNSHIWGAYRASEGWRPYVGVSEHTDHIHFSFSWAGALGRTSWWTGKVAPIDYGPCPPSSGGPAPAYDGPNLAPCPEVGTAAIAADPPYAGPGQRDPQVLAVQLRLRVRPLSGFYGPVTTAAVSAFQRRHGLTRTGITDWSTAYRLGLVGPAESSPYAALGRSGPNVLAVQRKLAVHPLTGYYGSVTAAAVSAFQRRHGLPRTGSVDSVTAYRLELGPPPTGTRAASAVYAELGSTGAGVLAVQRKLGVRPLSGWYRSVTAAAVSAFQRRHGLARTGIVDAVTAFRLGLT